MKKAPMRILFHDACNNLNIISALAYMHATLFEPNPLDLAQQAISDLHIQSKDVLTNIEKEEIQFSERIGQIVCDIEYELGVLGLVKPEINLLNTERNRVRQKISFLTDVLQKTQESEIVSKASFFYQEFRAIYEKAHVIGKHMAGLKDALVRIGKYPS